MKNSESFDSYEVKGHIRTLAASEDEVLVRVEVQSADADKDAQPQVETFKLCSRGPIGDPASSRLALLRDAFTSGALVQIDYNSNFDHCITKVTTQKKAIMETSTASLSSDRASLKN